MWWTGTPTNWLLGGGVEPHPSALQADANTSYARVPKMVVSTGFEPMWQE